MTKLTSNQLDTIKDFCEENEIELRENYSGRSMYGKTCIGFVTNENLFSLGFKLHQFLSEMSDPEIYQEELCDLEEVFDCGVNADSIGLSSIVYFPSISV